MLSERLGERGSGFEIRADRRLGSIELVRIGDRGAIVLAFRYLSLLLTVVGIATVKSAPFDL